MTGAGQPAIQTDRIRWTMLSFLRRLSVATCASLHPRLRKLCAVPTRRDEPAAPVDQRTPRFRDLSLGEKAQT